MSVDSSDDTPEPGQEFERDFGRTIERERTKRGWTADEAAKRAGVAPKTWQRLEDGRPVRNLTLNKVDRLFRLPEGTTFDVWQRRGDLQAELDNRKRGLAALIPSDFVADQLPIEGDQADENGAYRDFLDQKKSRRADNMIQVLAELSMDDLDKVINAAHSVRNAKSRELTRTMGLPWPLSLRHALRHEQAAMSPEIRDRFYNLNSMYMRAHEVAVRALARKLDEEQEGDSVETSAQLEFATQIYEDAVMTARQYAEAIAALLLANRKTNDQLTLVEVHDSGGDDGQR